MEYALLWGRANAMYYVIKIFPPPFVARRYRPWREIRGQRVASIFVREVKRVLGKCSKCEYESEYTGTYDFDHIDTREKVDNVSKMVFDGRSIGEIDAEIRKTRFLCANCHRERTAVQFNWKKK